MCQIGDHSGVAPVEALPATLEWKGEVLGLEPVDELSVLTVCDNVMDMLLPDQGPPERLPLAGMARLAPLLEAPTILGGKAADVPLAQHGFSALVAVRKGGRVRRPGTAAAVRHRADARRVHRTMAGEAEPADQQRPGGRRGPERALLGGGGHHPADMLAPPDKRQL